MEIKKLSSPLSKKEADALIPKMDWVIEIDTSFDGFTNEEICDRILESLKCIIGCGEDNFHDMAYWQKKLPTWLTKEIKILSKEEVDVFYKKEKIRFQGGVALGFWFMASGFKGSCVEMGRLYCF